MIGIYLSGTGNTKHCVEKLVNLLDDTARCIPLETPYIINMLENENTIVLGYPTQFSNAPFPIVVILSGISTFVRLIHSVKVYSGILVIFLEKVMLSS